MIFQSLSQGYLTILAGRIEGVAKSYIAQEKSCCKSCRVWVDLLTLFLGFGWSLKVFGVD